LRKESTIPKASTYRTSGSRKEAVSEKRELSMPRGRGFDQIKGTGASYGKGRKCPYKPGPKKYQFLSSVFPGGREGTFKRAMKQ